MNEVILTVHGNVVSDPIYRTTSNGDAFVTFRLAVNERKRTPDGSWVPGESQYFSVTAFRLLASNVNASITRGQLVSVTGRLRLHRYTDKDGNARTSVQIEAHDIAASMKFARVSSTPSTAVELPHNDRLGDERVSEAVEEAESDAQVSAVDNEPLVREGLTLGTADESTDESASGLAA